MTIFCCLCGHKAAKNSNRRFCEGHLAMMYAADCAIEDRVADMPVEPTNYPLRESTKSINS